MVSEHFLLRFNTGMRVSVPPRTCVLRRYAGVITACHEDGTYDVRYDDGNKETRKSPERLVPNHLVSGAVREGQAVQAGNRGVVGDEDAWI